MLLGRTKHPSELGVQAFVGCLNAARGPSDICVSQGLIHGVGMRDGVQPHGYAAESYSQLTTLAKLFECTITSDYQRLASDFQKLAGRHVLQRQAAHGTFERTL